MTAWQPTQQLQVGTLVALPARYSWWQKLVAWALRRGLPEERTWVVTAVSGDLAEIEEVR